MTVYEIEFTAGNISGEITVRDPRSVEPTVAKIHRSFPGAEVHVLKVTRTEA